MATRNSGYAAKAFDKYYTPGQVVSHDLGTLWQPPVNCEIWEPCAGDGGLARAISTTFARACFASDVAPDARQLHPVARIDFLKSNGLSNSSAVPLVIITNPPYGAQSNLAVRFLVRALDLTEPRGGSVCLLLPFGFDAARGRRGLVGSHPAFAAKITTSQRIRWRNVEQKSNGPSGDHAWFIWEWQVRRRNAWALRQLQVSPAKLEERSGVAG